MKRKSYPVLLRELDGKLKEFPHLRALLDYLKDYRSSPKLDQSISAKLPSRMKTELREVKKKTGVAMAAIVRLGIAAALKGKKE